MRQTSPCPSIPYKSSGSNNLLVEILTVAPSTAGAESSVFSTKQTQLERSSTAVVRACDGSSAPQSARPTTLVRRATATPADQSVGPSRLPVDKNANYVQYVARTKGDLFLSSCYDFVTHQTLTRRFNDTIPVTRVHTWCKIRDHLWCLGKTSAQ